MNEPTKITKLPVTYSQEDIENLLVALCDLIIDSFIKKQQTKGSETRHTNNELKDSFRDLNSRLSKSERV